MNLLTNPGAMKWILPVLTILCVSCTRQVIITEAEIKPDILYLEGDLKPFTGKCVVVYSDTSLVKEKFTYKKGRLHGEAISWYKNGNIRRKGYYEHGMISGKWEFWDAAGNKILEAAYFHDQTLGNPTIAPFPGQ
jgi:hypothetical protein